MCAQSFGWIGWAVPCASQSISFHPQHSWCFVDGNDLCVVFAWAGMTMAEWEARRASLSSSDVTRLRSSQTQMSEDEQLARELQRQLDMEHHGSLSAAAGETLPSMHFRGRRALVGLI